MLSILYLTKWMRSVVFDKLICHITLWGFDGWEIIGFGDSLPGHDHGGVNMSVCCCQA